MLTGLGGQTPLLSTVELYDRLREELPELVDTLIEKGKLLSIYKYNQY